MLEAQLGIYSAALIALLVAYISKLRGCVALTRLRLSFFCTRWLPDPPYWAVPVNRRSGGLATGGMRGL